MLGVMIASYSFHIIPSISFTELVPQCSDLVAAPKGACESCFWDLGHADVGITQRICSHVIPDMKQETASMMDSMLGDLF